MILRYRFSSAFRPPSIPNSVEQGVWVWRSIFHHEAPGNVMTRSSSRELCTAARMLSRALVLGVYIAIELELALRLVLACGLAGLRQVTLTPQVLLVDERLDLVGMIRLERGAGGMRPTSSSVKSARISSCSRRCV